MVRRLFSHVTTWVFDLDNTLYPREARLFDQIEDRMHDFMREALGIALDEARALRHRYWAEHGTTLAGLMAHHGVDPEAFLDAVHEIDLAALVEDAALRAAIDALPGRKIVYTNGSRGHAARVTAARGLGGAFDAIYGVEDAAYTPKPQPDAFAMIFARDGLDPGSSAMFEDDPRNLLVPHALGMRTVLVGDEDAGAHVHHRTLDLAGFLSQLA